MPSPTLLAVVPLILSTSLTQLASIDRASPTESAPRPTDSAALSRNAGIPSQSPGALAGLQGASLTYLHDRNTVLGRTADALFASVGLGPVALSLSEHWMRYGNRSNASLDEAVSGKDLGELLVGTDRTAWEAANLFDHRVTSLSFAFGGDAAGIGTQFNFLESSESAALSRLVTWDVGAFLRPTSFLSLGATAHNLNAPNLSGRRLARQFDLGLGVRPGTDRVELGIDWKFDDLTPLERSRLEVTAQGEVVEGILLSAGVSSTLEGRGVVASLGLTVHTDHFAAGYALGSSINAHAFSPKSHTAFATASTQKLRSASFLSQTALSSQDAVVVNVESFLKSASGLSSLLSGEDDGWLNLMATLDRIEASTALPVVVVHLEGTGQLGLARAEALANRLQHLRHGGKKVVAYLMGANDADYLVAAGCDRVVASPSANLFVNGFSFSSLFAGPLLEKLGVSVDVVRAGTFKTAPESFTRQDMSQEEALQLNAVLDVIYPRFVSFVAGARHLTTQKVEETIQKGVLTPKMALEAGLIDQVAQADELAEVASKLVGRDIRLRGSVPQAPDVPISWGRQPQVALIRIDGLIVGGNGGNVLGQRRTGSTDIIQALYSAWGDSQVKAIVLAIDSGGGSSSASDLMWRAVQLVSRDKPVIVSLSDVAASGAYYVASAGTEVFASPSTLTGSIGVFIAKPAFQNLMSKVGISTETLRRGSSADLMSLSRPWSDEERAAVQASVDDAYDLFLSRVAAGRKMSVEDVAKVADGRVWVGSEAHQKGLVDQLGGLSDALKRAAELGGIDKDERLHVVPFTGRGFGQRVSEAISVTFGTNPTSQMASSAPFEALLAESNAWIVDFLTTQALNPLAMAHWTFR